MQLRDLLIKYIEKKEKTYGKYSLSKLSLDTGVSKTTLSGFINKDRVPSRENLFKIAQTVTTNKAILKKYSTELATIKQSKHRKKIISYKLFKEISDWEYFAIIGLTRLKDNSANEDWIADKLSIEKSRAKKCLKKLLKEGLLKIKDNRLYKDYKHLGTPTEISNQDIKKAHSQAINLSEEAMYTIPFKHRQYITSNLTIKDEDLVEAREELDKLVKKFIKKYNCETEADALYKLNIQFFPLTSVE